MKITPNSITKLKKNEIFVFGSNEAGVHGAAKTAVDKFGAEMGNSFGLQGQSFAIPTKDKQIKTLPIPEISIHVTAFINGATCYPQYYFLVTEIGCGLAGYKPSDIAPLFKDALALKNVSLPQSFVDILSTEPEVSGYKGTDKDIKCRSFQYALGGEYEEKGEPKACNNGFHFCENPLDVLNYYPLANGNRYFSVTGKGKFSRHDEDSKVASSKIKIGLEISLKSLVEDAVKFIFEKTKSTENSSATTGYGANSATTGEGCISACLNGGGKAKASLGSWIVISEWERGGDYNWNVIDVKSFKVDGVKIKADTFYILTKGEAKETE